MYIISSDVLSSVSIIWRWMIPYYVGIFGPTIGIQIRTMATAIRKLYSPEELAKHAEPPHDDPGVQLVMIEQWDSIEERILFSKNVVAGRQKEIFPYLLPNHSHEFYEDRSVT